MTPSAPIVDSTVPGLRVRKEVNCLRDALQRVITSNSLRGARWAAQEGLREDRRIASEGASK